jgi:hypothetical protein
MQLHTLRRRRCHHHHHHHLPLHFTVPHRDGRTEKDVQAVQIKAHGTVLGGVITSSYEICAAMLLSEDEFYEHKDAIVEEVLAVA